ncbi:Transposon Ty3-I Gag-Pol polyprotein [Araneus ventricosus]|uniref:Transposon Ty3-I Gag-Pol polyprotein n=1 Tax=Araneus ventricosus TaxID=182803 RepID=A0A4Y2KKY2_ARAVE|nr:Transposon Ty3-I Gag-Pol polyprotein [Araneus ventricosus]
MSLHVQENTNNKVDNQDGIVNTSEEIFPPLIVKQLSPPILSLLSKYSHVFSKNKYDVGKIRIEPTRINLTSDLPVSQRAYRTSATEEVEINKQVKNLLAAGLIKETDSCYSSPVTLAYKRDEMKKTRLCIDFRKLNAICKNDAEPLPQIDTLLDKLTNAKIFSVLDLASEEHFAHLEQIFKICEEENIKLKFSKCVFAKDKINFFGYEIKEGYITPDNHNIESIKKLQPPNNVKQLQGFLGSVNVYNKFIDSYAKIREPLNQLLKKDKQWHWTAECQEAFELLKNKLVTKPVLQLYDPKLPLHVFCDASQVAIGAVLKQPDSSGNLHSVSYHSRTLRIYEKNYCITELECLAIVDALDKFYYYLHGKKFITHTDHAALVWLKNVKNLNGRLFRWSLKLSMFDYEVKYLKGTANVEADMLSRHPTAQYIQHSVHLLELDEMKTHQNLVNLYNSKYKKINDVLVLKKKKII